jgi:hypothetical protein
MKASNYLGRGDADREEELLLVASWETFASEIEQGFFFKISS